ncbi:MAG: L-2-amino-thiazoline-4-carboxylic acid hydrolase [Thermoanaerobacteraceae bacterium]|nr:L-2-amino-thiazoline-4-carboxylic acid hydrolase [Thermoanaerobacteraceae bacterium]
MKHEFTANQHALLFGWIAKEVIIRCGDEGKEALKLGVIKYGKQRGRRMAERVKADGFELSVPNYMAYGEWQAKQGDMDLRFAIQDKDLNMQAHKCPWYQEWKDNNLLEYAYIYCQYVDEAIVKGYNPNLKLDVPENRAEGAQFCDFWFRNANMTEKDFEYIKDTKEKLSGKAVMPWDYHIGHLYKTMEEVIVSKLKDKGKEAMKAAIDTFAKHFGQEAADIVLSFRDTDFNKMPKYEGIAK